MSMSSIPSPSPNGKLYSWVEKIGNKVPHPFLLFIYLIVVLAVATAALSAFGVGVINPTDGSTVVVKTYSASKGYTGFCRTSSRTSADLPRWGRFWRWCSARDWPNEWVCCRR